MMGKKEKQPWNPFPLAVLNVEGLSRGAKHVLTVLAARSNWKGETCVGHRRLTKDCQSSKQYVTDALKELYAKGIVKAAVRGRKKNQADWKTISPSVLNRRIEPVSSPTQQDYSEEMQSCPAGVEKDSSPTEQDYISECSPTQQGKTLQIKKSLNLAGQPNPNLAEGVSKLVSQSPSAAAPPAGNCLTILKHIYPNRVPEIGSEELKTLEAVASRLEDWDAYFAWHRSHKPEALRWRSLTQFLSGVEYSLNDYAGHAPATCRVCKKAALKSDGKALPAYRQESGTRPILQEGMAEFEAAIALAPKGKGFDVEESE